MRALQYLSRAVSAEQLSGVRNVGAYVMAMITDPRHAREPGPREREGGGHHRGGARGSRDGRRGDKCARLPRHGVCSRNPTNCGAMPCSHALMHGLERLGPM